MGFGCTCIILSWLHYLILPVLMDNRVPEKNDLQGFPQLPGETVQLQCHYLHHHVCFIGMIYGRPRPGVLHSATVARLAM